MFRAAFLVNLVSRRRVSEGPIELIAVARDAMLAQLRRRCESAGVTMRFGRRLENPNETLDAGVDLTCRSRWRPQCGAALARRVVRRRDTLRQLLPRVARHPRLFSRTRRTRFTLLKNRTWHAGNVVLLGDAAHTAHCCRGFGTKHA